MKPFILSAAIGLLCVLSGKSQPPVYWNKSKDTLHIQVNKPLVIIEVDGEYFKITREYKMEKVAKDSTPSIKFYYGYPNSILTPTTTKL